MERRRPPLESKIVSKPGDPIQLTVVRMPEEIKREIARSLALGKKAASRDEPAPTK